MVSVTPGFRAGILCLGVLTAGCAYSFRGSLPPGLRTVEIVQFRSSVAEYGLETELTSAVTEGIVTDGRLSVATGDPDSRISGRVTAFTRSAEEYTSGEQVQRYRLELRVEIKMEDLRTGDPLIQNETVGDWILYDPGSETLVHARDRIVRETAAEIVRKCLSGW